eukprot:c35171_g1_i1 orf=108-380(+)
MMDLFFGSLEVSLSLFALQLHFLHCQLDPPSVQTRFNDCLLSTRSSKSVLCLGGFDDFGLELIHAIFLLVVSHQSHGLFATTWYCAAVWC